MNKHKCLMTKFLMKKAITTRYVQYHSGHMAWTMDVSHCRVMKSV